MAIISRTIELKTRKNRTAKRTTNKKSTAKKSTARRSYLSADEKTRQKQERAAAAFNAVCKAFQTPAALEKIARSCLRAELPPFKSSAWSFKNQCIMFANGFDIAMSFKQWQTLNRQVKKGESAFFIWAPCIASKKKDDDDEKDDAEKEEQKKARQQEKEDDEKEDDGEKKTVNEITPYAFKLTPVFGYEQTDGAPLEYKENLKPFRAPRLIDVAKKLNIPVSYQTFSYDRGYYGYYRHAGENKNIVLASPDDETFFHELAHAVHDHLGKRQGKTTPQAEIVAEFSAAVLCVMCGLQPNKLGTCYKYIEYYQKQASKKEFFAALDDVKSVLDYIVTTTTDDMNEYVPLF